MLIDYNCKDRSNISFLFIESIIFCFVEIVLLYSKAYGFGKKMTTSEMNHANYLYVVYYFLGSTFGLILAIYSTWFGDWEMLSEEFVCFLKMC